MIRITKSRAGELADAPLWIIWHGMYMYESVTLIGAFYKFITQYKDDRNIVG